jgi:regulator of protease activity HflC (stomatin/prohibitin superfamily)
MPDFISLSAIVLFLMLLVVLVLLSGIRIAQQYQRGVVFRLGLFTGIRGPGIYWLIPFIEWQRLIDVRTVTVAV